MNKYQVMFYYKDYPTVDSPIIIEAIDQEWAEQVLLLMLNSKIGIPGNWDRHDKPQLIG